MEIWTREKTNEEKAKENGEIYISKGMQNALDRINNKQSEPKISVGKFILWYIIIFCIMGVLFGGKM